MSTIKQYSEREFVKILRNNGFKQQRSSGGSHIIYKDDKNREISFPQGRGGKDPNKMMINRLIKENNLEV